MIITHFDETGWMWLDLSVRTEICVENDALSGGLWIGRRMGLVSKEATGTHRGLGQQEQDNDASKHLHGILDSTYTSQRKVPWQAANTLILNWAQRVFVKPRRAWCFATKYC
jgi:hypothetical protein